MSVETQADSAGARLKAETAEHHRRAETHAFQKALASGSIGREGYASWLAQMWHMHKALEAPLAEARAASPAIAAIVTEEQFQVPYLESDLSAFGIDPASTEPCPTARAFAEQMGKLDPTDENDRLTLLGMHYVVEGSNNGNRFIVRSIAPALGLTPDQVRYLVPYGERQPELWAAFKTELNAQGWEGEKVDHLVKAAGEMFDWIYRLSDDLAVG